VDAEFTPKYNRINIDKTFNVSSFIAAYNFESRINEKNPYWESYDFAQIFLIQEGEGTYYTEDGEYELHPGQMIYRPPFKKSMYHWKSAKSSFAIIDFDCDSIAMNIFGNIPFQLYGEESAMLLDLIKTGARICRPINHENGRIGFKLKDDIPQVVVSFIGASLERFLSMVYCRLKNITFLLDESQKSNKYINESKLISEVKAYMSNNITSKLTINDISEEFGVNPTTLMKLFKNDTNKSVMEYFTDLKISTAKHMIRSSSSNFTEIAETLGFTSVNYFSKVFKAKTGLTPTEYSQQVSKRMTYSIC